MTTDRQADSDVFRSVLIEDARQRAGDHPELDILVAYLTDALDREADEQVRDHLAGCRRCTIAVLDLEPLVKPDAAPEGVADLELETAWRDLRSRIEDSPRLEDSESGFRSPGPSRWPLALAASLLVAAVGLSVWVSQLRQATSDLQQQVAELSEPQVNPPIVYLDGVTRSEPTGAVAELSADQPFVLLIVIPSAPELFSSYEAWLADETGETVWSGSGLELSEEETLRLRLPRALLPAGDYRVRIEGVAGDQTGDRRESVVETSLRVVYP